MTDPRFSILHDTNRLAGLRQLELLDSPPEEVFDRLTRLASKIVNAPVSLVSLVDADRQFFKSSVGLPEPWASKRETPLSDSFCQHVVASGEPLIIEDARDHSMLSPHLAIPGLNIIAYLGIPLSTADGTQLGSFCVIDNVPRMWTEREIEIIQELADAAIVEIEIRKQKQNAEAAMQEHEVRLQRLFENAQDVIYRYRLIPAPGLEYINPSITAITGYTTAECYADPDFYFGIIYEEDKGLLDQLLASGQEVNNYGVIRLVHKDGSIVWTEQQTVLIYDETGRLVAIEGIVRDITARKQAERQLLESEQRFRTLFDQSPVPITISRYGVLLYVNAAFARMMGYDDPAAVVSMPILNHVAPDRREVMAATNFEPLQGVVMEDTAVRKDGTEFPVYIRANQIELPDGAATVAFITDLTERRRVEETARKADLLRMELAKEREIIDLKERFISTVSHDFRTPLTVITMASGLLEMRQNTSTPEQHLKQIHYIQSQAKHMTQLLDDVLTFSAASAGKITFNPTPIDLFGFCSGLLEQFRMINEKKQNLVFTSHGNLNDLPLDEVLLRHILVNLMSNAVKYSPEGGEVHLEVERQADAVVLRIHDQGIGIPLSEQTRLFEPFHRAKNALKISGTGLGLPIVKSNVEAHRGTIAVNSAEGAGTTFTVCLPILPHLLSRETISAQVTEGIAS